MVDDNKGWKVARFGKDAGTSEGAKKAAETRRQHSAQHSELESSGFAHKQSNPNSSSYERAGKPGDYHEHGEAINIHHYPKSGKTWMWSHHSKNAEGRPSVKLKEGKTAASLAQHLARVGSKDSAMDWKVGRFAKDVASDEVRHDPSSGQFTSGSGGGGGSSKPTKTHHPEIEQHHKSLKAKSTSELLKMHHNMDRVGSKHTAAEVGGKQGMIADLLRNHHGNKKVAEHFGLSK